MDVYKAYCAHYVALHQGGEHTWCKNIHNVCTYAGVCKQKDVCQSKKASVKARCKTQPWMALQFLVCNNCPIHPEQDYFSFHSCRFAAFDLPSICKTFTRSRLNSLSFSRMHASVLLQHIVSFPTKSKEFFRTHCQNRHI